MSNKVTDPVVEVRQNRERILAEFGGDIHAYDQYIKAQQPIFEAEGWRFATLAELSELKHRTTERVQKN